MDICRVCLGHGEVTNVAGGLTESTTCPICDGVGVVWNYKDALKAFKCKLLYNNLRRYSLIVHTVDKQQVSYMWIDSGGYLVVEHRVGSESEVIFL